LLLRRSKALGRVRNPTIFDRSAALSYTAGVEFARGGAAVRRSDLELIEYLPYLINRVGSALAARFTEDELAAHGLSIAMWRVLAVLSSNGGQRQIDLAELTSIDASTLSRLVTRLVRMGLVTRSRSRTNSREVIVALTAKGRALLNRLIPVALGLEGILSFGVAKKDLATVKRALRRMYANVNRPPDSRRRNGG
jgi:MarR family transcriptional regulator, organic hydroperoxide resistance regulator